VLQVLPEQRIFATLPKPVGDETQDFDLSFFME